MRLGIVGYGVVGRHMEADIIRAGHECIVYDIRRELAAGETHETINACAAAFVCVSTPQAADGSCDLSAILDVFKWLEVPVAIIRSTVPPGTTELLPISRSGKEPCVVFCPEFIGEGVNAPYNHMTQPPFLIIGGTREAQNAAGPVLRQLYNAECEFVFVGSREAELAKYAENYYLALKVSWANELYDIAAKVGADYDAMMQAVTHDYRIGRSHTAVYPDRRGFDGRCLPKDCNALLNVVGADTAPLLAAMLKHNGRWKK